MNIQPTPSNERTIEPQESILSNMVDVAPFERALKNARIWLYIVAGIQMVTGFYEYYTIENKITAAVALGIDSFIALTFFLLAQWSKKSPETAFLLALIVYILFVIGLVALDAANIYRGIIIKIVVVIALVKAYNSARLYQQIKTSLGD